MRRDRSIMHGMIFEIYKLYLVVFVVGIMIFCVLSMYLIYKSFTINTDVTVTYSKQIKIYNFLKVNFFCNGCHNVFDTLFVISMAA